MKTHMGSYTENFSEPLLIPAGEAFTVIVSMEDDVKPDKNLNGKPEERPDENVTCYNRIIL